MVTLEWKYGSLVTVWVPVVAAVIVCALLSVVLTKKKRFRRPRNRRAVHPTPQSSFASVRAHSPNLPQIVITSDEQPLIHFETSKTLFPPRTFVTTRTVTEQSQVDVELNPGPRSNDSPVLLPPQQRELSPFRNKSMELKANSSGFSSL